jgi:outer membrane biogenesis lipoprotein LolB
MTNTTRFLLMVVTLLLTACTALIAPIKTKNA